MNGLICSLLYRFSPDQLRMILVDPKFIEFRAYQDIPHLLLPVVDDAKEASVALKWAVREMERRYRILAKLAVRNLADYNRKVDELGPEVVRDLLSEGEDTDWAQAFETGDDAAPKVGKLPYIVVIIDELADLMMIARKEVEVSIARIAQKARAAGIHLVLEDQAVERWPRALSANVAGTAIGRMPLYAAQACGFVARRGMTTETLQPGQFWYGGQLLRTPHMQPELRTLLASVPAPRRLVMQTPRWEGAAGASQSVSNGVFPEAETRKQPETPTPQAETNTGNAPDAGKWYDYILSYMGRPEGTGLWNQPAQGVRELARAMSVLETGNETSEDNYVSIASKVAKQIRAAARLPNGDRLGTDITGGA
jgi:hypothetical protein